MGDVVEMFEGALDANPYHEDGDPYPAAAQMLRNMAEMAEKGEFQSIAVVAVSRDATVPVIDAMDLDVNPFVMLAGLDEVMTVLRDANLEKARFSNRSFPSADQ